MKTAVVILNWNGKALLEKFLPLVVLHSQSADIYLADNASSDDSVEFVATVYPQIKIIQNSGNLGYASGYNQALKHVNADLLVLLNSDVEVTANWLEPVISLFEKEPQTAIAQPKLLDFKNKEYFEYAGAAGGFIDRYGFPFCRGRIFDSLEKDSGQYDDVETIFWASGACFFIRESVFDSLGGFDDRFFAHQEEIDLCWRAFNAGFVSRYVSESVVYHVGGATLKEGSPKKTYLNFRNSLLMLHKNLPAGKRFSIIFIRMVFDGIAAIRFLSQGKSAHFIAVAKSHFNFYGHLFPFGKKKNFRGKSNYFKIKSIVYDHFVRSKSKYPELF